MLDSSPYILYLFTKKKQADFTSLEQKLGIDALEQKAIDGVLKLNMPQMATWMTWLKETLNISDIALHVAYFSDLSVIGMLGNVLQVCRTIRDATEISIKWAETQNPFFDIKMEEDEKWVTIRYVLNKELEKQYPLMTKGLILSFVASACLNMNKLIIEKRLPLDRVTLTCIPEDASARIFKKIYGIVPEFDALENSVRYEKKWLDSPIVSYNKDILNLLSTHFSAQMQAAKREAGQETLGQSIKNDIITAFKALRSISVDDIAEMRAMSVRAVQRKLKNENTSFRQLHELAREELALALFKSKKTSVKEVAYLLGYSGISAFSKAFRRWKQMSPKDFRAMNS